MFRGTTRARSASCCNLNGSPFTKHVYWALCCNLKGSPFTKQVYWHKQSKQLKIQRMQRQQCKETDMSLHWLHFELHARFVQIYMHRNGWLLTDLADNMADNQGLPPWLTTRDYSPTWLTTWLTTKDYSNQRPTIATKDYSNDHWCRQGDFAIVTMNLFPDTRYVSIVVYQLPDYMLVYNIKYGSYYLKRFPIVLNLFP